MSDKLFLQARSATETEEKKQKLTRAGLLGAFFDTQNIYVGDGEKPVKFTYSMIEWYETTLPTKPETDKLYKFTKDIVDGTTIKYFKGMYFPEEDSTDPSGYVWNKLADDELYITDIEKLGDYLYKVDFDKLPEYREMNSSISGGCTSYVKDGKLYRSFDYNYNENCEFLVSFNGIQGMAYINGMENGKLKKDDLEQLPYHLVDGVNKHGIMASVHMLYNDFSQTSYTGEDALPATKAIYYILSNLEDINDVPNLTELDKLKLPQSFIANEQCVQFFITDGTTSYIVTPDGGNTMSKIELPEDKMHRLTNFKYYTSENASRTDADIQARPNGIERYNMINSETQLSDLRFTKAYESTDRLSEFIGENDTTKESTDAELEAVYDIAHTKYETRTRNGETWQSVHAIVYSTSGALNLYTQEDYDKDYLTTPIGGFELVEDDLDNIENPSDDILYILANDVYTQDIENPELKYRRGAYYHETEQETIYTPTALTETGRTGTDENIIYTGTEEEPISHTRTASNDKTIDGFSYYSYSDVYTTVSTEPEETDIPLFTIDEESVKKSVYKNIEAEKIFVYQGEDNKDKILRVNEDGNLELVDLVADSILKVDVLPEIKDAKETILYNLMNDQTDESGEVIYTKGLYYFTITKEKTAETEQEGIYTLLSMGDEVISMKVVEELPTADIRKYTIYRVDSTLDIVKVYKIVDESVTADEDGITITASVEEEPTKVLWQDVLANWDDYKVYFAEDLNGNIALINDEATQKLIFLEHGVPKNGIYVYDDEWVNIASKNIKINGVELIGDQSSSDLKIIWEGNETEYDSLEDEDKQSDTLHVIETTEPHEPIFVTEVDDREALKYSKDHTSSNYKINMTFNEIKNLIDNVSGGVNPIGSMTTTTMENIDTQLTQYVIAEAERNPVVGDEVKVVLDDGETQRFRGVYLFNKLNSWVVWSDVDTIPNATQEISGQIKLSTSEDIESQSVETVTTPKDVNDIIESIQLFYDE